MKGKIVKVIMDHRIAPETEAEYSLSRQVICECGDWFKNFAEHADHVAMQILDLWEK